MKDKGSKINKLKKEALASKISVPKVKFAKLNLKSALTLHNIVSVLAIVYYIIWIPVGIFLVWFIFANFRAGVFDQLVSAQNQNIQTPQVQTDQPTETTVPGVGRVNIECVQNSISEESIIKMVQERGTQNLSDDEKLKLEPCILEKDTSSPQPDSSPSQ